jgi:DNA gyrase subunit A
LEGAVDLRDESDRQGMRIVLELSRTVEPKKVLKRLFKLTPLQGTFSINMLGLVDGEPRLLPLKRSLQLFVEHRQEIITRRSQYELERARQREHILAGLRIALASLDEVIQTIRSSRTPETARKNLRRSFKLSDSQATAILDMPLRRLAALERKKIEKEYKEVQKQIKELESLLKSRKKILQTIKQELTDLKEKYGSPRRTVIIDHSTKGDKLLTARELIPAEDRVVAVSREGRLCSWPAAELLNPARGRHVDPLQVAVLTNTRDMLYLFGANGRALVTPMHQVPKGTAPGEGPSLTEFATGLDETIVAGISLSADERPGYLFLVSRQAKVKRIALSDLRDIRNPEAVVMGLDAGDSLLSAFLTEGEGEVILVSGQGQAIRFAEEEVRAMGLPAGGVLGMKLAQGDEIVGGGFVETYGQLVVVSENGFGKRVEPEEFPTQGRYGQGVIGMALDQESGPLVAATMLINLNDRVMLVSDKKNNKTVYGRSLPAASRTHKGQPLMSIRDRDRVARLITLPT